MVEPTGPDAPSEMHAGPLHHRLWRDDLRDLARGWAHSSGLHSPPARGWARTSRLDIFMFLSSSQARFGRCLLHLLL